VQAAQTRLPPRKTLNCMSAFIGIKEASLLHVFFAGYRDGAILPTVPADGVFTDSGSFESNIALRLGRWGTLSIYFDGRIGEYILWPADLLANRERIEGDIAWYY